MSHTHMQGRSWGERPGQNKQKQGITSVELSLEAIRENTHCEGREGRGTPEDRIGKEPPESNCWRRTEHGSAALT